MIGHRDNWKIRILQRIVVVAYYFAILWAIDTVHIICVYIYIHKMIGLTKRWDHHSSTLRKNGTHRPIEMVMKLFHFTSLSRLSLRWISGMFSLASNRHTTLAGPLR